VGGGGPAEDEEPGGEEHGPEHHGWEARFRDGFVAVSFEFADVELVVSEVVSRLTKRSESGTNRTLAPPPISVPRRMARKGASEVTGPQ
jgi:hypothetical protein